MEATVRVLQSRVLQRASTDARPPKMVKKAPVTTQTVTTGALVQQPIEASLLAGTRQADRMARNGKGPPPRSIPSTCLSYMLKIWPNTIRRQRMR